MYHKNSEQEGGGQWHSSADQQRQNAYSLQKWVESNPDARPLYISYTSSIPLDRLGIESKGDVPRQPTAGWMVVGVNRLFTRSGRLDWLHEHEPVAMIGHAVWVYKIDESDL